MLIFSMDFMFDRWTPGLRGVPFKSNLLIRVSHVSTMFLLQQAAAVEPAVEQATENAPCLVVLLHVRLHPPVCLLTIHTQIQQ